MQLSVVMAAMNESASIIAMIEQIKQFSPKDTEILLVDSSTDDTPKLAKMAGAIVISESPEGHGMALKKGLNESKGEVVITMDCDLTYPTDRIPDFIKLITQKNYDLVSGCRMTKKLKKEMPPLNKIANFGLAWLTRLLYRIDTHDVTTGMFAMKRELAHVFWKGNRSLPAEIIIRANLMKKRYMEVPIDYKLRVGESTLQKWRSGKAYLRCLFYWKFGWFGEGEL